MGIHSSILCQTNLLSKRHSKYHLAFCKWVITLLVQVSLIYLHKVKKFNSWQWMFACWYKSPAMTLETIDCVMDLRQTLGAFSCLWLSSLLHFPVSRKLFVCAIIAGIPGTPVSVSHLCRTLLEQC